MDASLFRLELVMEQVLVKGKFLGHPICLERPRSVHCVTVMKKKLDWRRWKISSIQHNENSIVCSQKPLCKIDWDIQQRIFFLFCFRFCEKMGKIHNQTNPVTITALWRSGNYTGYFQKRFWSLTFLLIPMKGPLILGLIEGSNQTLQVCF